jgi:hypothetical protein
MNGVFNTFNSYTGNYRSAEWHNFWCNGTVERINSSTSSDAGLNVGFAKISLGMSYADAKEFQRVYQTINCGTNSGATENYSTNTVIRKVASPELLRAYVDCKRLQSSGLLVDMSVRPDDKKVFVVDVKFTGAWGGTGASGPKVKKVSFMPNVISSREGSLQDGVELAKGQTYSMICERSTDIPITVYVETETGTFHADLPPFTPPPTDQEKIMAAMPRGSILGWYDPTKFPKGWALCDGKNGTPDLNDRFPVGTTNNTVLGDKTGDASHQHTFSGKTDYPQNLDGAEFDRYKNGGPHAMQKDGGQRVLHYHTYSGATQPASSLPPATRIMFIMKL